nr:MAG TPA: replisome organizer [Caudoviricetes sp.]
MPNRIIKESIRTSKSVNALNDFEFRVWLYLITYVDDYGRGSADPELLKGFVFPRRKAVTEQQIKRALDNLAITGMINLYEVGGESFFCFPNWSKHQRIQTKKSKFPEPDDTALQKPTVNHRESPPESESESESESKSEGGCAEPQAASTPPAISLPLNDGTEYSVSVEQCQEWAGLYPAVDVIQQLRNMKGWLSANPTRRKTKRGINAFIVRWLSDEQNKSRSQPAQYGRAAKPGYGEKKWNQGVQAHGGELTDMQQAAIDRMLAENKEDDA